MKWRHSCLFFDFASSINALYKNKITIELNEHLNAFQVKCSSAIYCLSLGQRAWWERKWWIPIPSWQDILLRLKQLPYLDFRVLLKREETEIWEERDVRWEKKKENREIQRWNELIHPLMLIKWRKYRGVKTETYQLWQLKGQWKEIKITIKICWLSTSSDKKSAKIVSEKTEEQAASEVSTGSSSWVPLMEKQTLSLVIEGDLHEAELMTLSVTHLSCVCACPATLSDGPLETANSQKHKNTLHYSRRSVSDSDLVQKLHTNTHTHVSEAFMKYLTLVGLVCPLNPKQQNNLSQNVLPGGWIFLPKSLWVKKIIIIIRICIIIINYNNYIMNE